MVLAYLRRPAISLLLIEATELECCTHQGCSTVHSNFILLQIVYGIDSELILMCNWKVLGWPFMSSSKQIKCAIVQNWTLSIASIVSTLKFLNFVSMTGISHFDRLLTILRPSKISISSVEYIFHIKDKITTLIEYFQMRHNYNGSDHHSGQCYIAWLLCQINWVKYIHLHVHGSETGPKRRVDAL